jgi:hypothetical protein
MKTLKQYRTEQEASIDSLILKEKGIEFIIIKNDGGPYPSLTDIYGYSICVKEGAFPFCDHQLTSFSFNLAAVANRNRSFQRPAL